MDAGDLEARLARAIREQRLRLHFQPVVSLPSGRPTGAEALARWDDEELGPVPPDRFIAVAESTGRPAGRQRDDRLEVQAQALLADRPCQAGLEIAGVHGS